MFRAGEKLKSRVMSTVGVVGEKRSIFLDNPEGRMTTIPEQGSPNLQTAMCRAAERIKQRAERTMQWEENKEKHAFHKHQQHVAYVT